MAQLAIKGHAIRGKEVIEILEMLGGKDVGYSGIGSQYYYYIDEYGNIAGTTELPNNKTFVIYTLEKFLEKYPYKIGAKVTHSNYESPLEIVGMKWENDSIKYEVYTNDYGYWFSVDELQPYKEETMEENIKEKCDLINFNSHYIFNFADRVELILKDGWEVKNEDGRTYVVKKKSKYPKTYGECCDVLSRFTEYDLNKKRELLLNVNKLIKCRDAYWKIAGEEMGWDKPWKPDYIEGVANTYYTIYVFNNKLFRAGTSHRSVILAFPTEKIRDAFYENFKDLIEQCKELL